MHFRGAGDFLLRALGVKIARHNDVSSDSKVYATIMRKKDIAPHLIIHPIQRQGQMPRKPRALSQYTTTHNFSPANVCRFSSVRISYV